MVSSGVEAILNFLPISDAIGTAGQPTAEQFAAIRTADYDIVVNLALPNSTNALPNEWELVTELCMTYVLIPVQWEHPTQVDLQQFFGIMDGFLGKRIFVHCVMNMRVSAFMLLYRVLRLRVPLETARQDMLRIWEPNETWQQFIDDALAQ